MVFLLEFFTSKTGIILIVAFLVWGAYNHAVNNGVDEAIKAANTARQEIVQQYQTKSELDNKKQREEVATAYAKGQKEMKDKLDGISKKVTKVADSQCTITAGFLQSYTAAFNLPSLPIPAGGNVDSPTGVPISNIARADTINGAIAIDYKREVSAWREWFKRNKTAYDKYCAESKSCGPALDVK